MKNKALMFVLAGALAFGSFPGAAYAAASGIPQVPQEQSTIAAMSETEGYGMDKAMQVPLEETKALESVSETKEAAPGNDNAVPVKETAVAESAAAVKGDGVKDGDTSFSERILYTTYDRNADPRQYLEGTVKINGITYELKETGNPVYIRQQEVMRKQYFYESEVFTGNEDEHLPEEIVAVDGVSYGLVSKELVEQTAEERTEFKETVVEYKDVEAGVVLPKEKEITFTDTDTGQEVQAVLQYEREQVISEQWSENFEFPITISNYDADLFILNGKEVPKDAALIDYAADFLESLHLDPEAYRISSIDWNGASYEESGIIKRDAIAKGSKHVRNVNVTYGGTVILPSIAGKSWSCVYEEIIPEGQEVLYTMAVDTTYNIAVQTVEVETGAGLFDTIVGYITAAYEAVVEAFHEHPVISSIPLLAVAGLLAFFITRKVQNRCIYDKNIKCPNQKRKKDTCKSCVHYRGRQKI